MIYLDGSPVYEFDPSDVTLSADFAGSGIQLFASVPTSSLPPAIETKSRILHFVVSATIS